VTIKYHTEADGSPLIQGSDAWKAARCGLLTASEMKLVLTPTLKCSVNEKATGHLYKLMVQRITGHVNERYISDDMLRGKEDEIDARILYDKHCALVQEVGFITNAEWGFTLGYSPDGLVDVDGLFEAKSRRDDLQVKDMIEHVKAQTVPDEFTIQCQTGLLVSKRNWIDLAIISCGLPMPVIRAVPISSVQSAILDAAYAFEKRMAEKMDEWHALLKSGVRLIPTERRVYEDIIV
jgi:hypothetical protein